MDKNYFDIVMAHIEENVNMPTEIIKREIPKLIGRHSRAFSETFFMLTGYTLDYYIKQRRLHYSARELLLKQDKSICDIALEYQFSDQAAFSRAFKEKYKFTAGEFRKNGFWPSEEPLSFRQISEGNADTRTERILQRLTVGNMDVDEMEFWYEIDRLNESKSLDVDACIKIMDLAETLDISPKGLYEYCVSASIEEDNIARCLNCTHVLVHTGADTEKELKAICEHFNCEHWSANGRLVEKYRESDKTP